MSNASFNAHNGKKLTDDHKKKIAQSLLERGKGKKYIIQAKNANDGRIMYFENGQAVANKLKCSRQLVSQCLRREARNNHQHSARGWILTKMFVEEMCLIRGVNATTNESLIFWDEQDAADYLGCSRELVSQALCDNPRNSNQNSCKGWVLSKMFAEEIQENQ